MLIRLSLLLALALPIAMLTSIGCGVFALPVEGPKVAIVNSKLIAITSDLVDDAGQSLDAVTATVELRSIRAGGFIVTEFEDIKTEPPTTFDKTYKYTSFGHYAIIVTFTKEGYGTRKIVYSLEDQVTISNTDGWGSRSTPLNFPDSDRINTTKDPHSKIVLTKNP